MRTVAFSVNRPPAAGALSLTVGVSTTRSGARATVVVAKETLDTGPVPAELMVETR